MSPDERQLLTGLFDRIRGAAATPRDPEAEALISDAVKAMPFAPYLLAQAVIVQDHALQAANAKLQELEARIRDMEQQQQPSQAAGTGGFLGGLGSIFGSGSPRAAPPPPQPSPWGQQPQQPSYQQPYEPPPPPSGDPWGGAPGMGAPLGGGMMGGGGGGFLKGALGAAAGVAGGVLLADSIRGLFGAHNNPLGIGSGFGGLGGGLGSGMGGSETVVNNYYEDSSDNAADVNDADDSDSMQDASYDDDSSNDDGSYDV